MSTLQFEDFYKAVQKGTEPTGSLKEAYKDFEIIIRSLQSAEKMKRMAVTPA